MPYVHTSPTSEVLTAAKHRRMKYMPTGTAVTYL